LVTLIFAMTEGAFLEQRVLGGVDNARGYSTAKRLAKANALCTFSPSFSLAARG
jgi:hypothetical protein